MPMLRDASRTKLLSKKLGMNRIHSVPDAEPSRFSHAAAPPPLVVDLTMGLSVGRLNAYWLRDVLAVDLAFEQDADREVVEHDQPAAPAEGVESRKLGQRPRQAGNHVACERQPLARVLAVLGDETPRPGDVHLCHEVDRAALPADRCGRSNHLSVACLLYTSPSPRDRTRSRMP